MKIIAHSVFAALLVCGGVVAAAAQSPPVQSAPGQSPPAHVDPKGCAPGEQLQTNGTAAPQQKSNESLSDKLARTDGVLCPPNVDPEIRAPTPPTGRTPVIPPPGSPGGDPSIQPK